MCDTGIEWIKDIRIWDCKNLFTEYLPEKLAYFLNQSGFIKYSFIFILVNIKYLYFLGEPTA